MWERVASEEGDVQRGQVHVKWKPCWRCPWREDVGSRGEVSACVSTSKGEPSGECRIAVKNGLHDIVISSPSAIGRVTRTVCVKRFVSITYCALSSLC